MTTTPTPRVRFATLDSSLLARKGEARPAMPLPVWTEGEGEMSFAEVAQRMSPPGMEPQQAPLATATSALALRPWYEAAPNVPAVQMAPAGAAAPQAAPEPDGRPLEVPVGCLRPSRMQPRRAMAEPELAELADSIREHGVLQPIVVRPLAGEAGQYEIVAGERRWRAARMAGIGRVPVIVREVADGTALELALVENLQREDLAPLDEAAGLRRLVDEFGHTQEDVARLIGKSRSHVANTLRLLGLPDEIKCLLADRRITEGHGRALLGAADPVALASAVVAEGLTVRETERRAQATREVAADKPQRVAVAASAPVEPSVQAAAPVPEIRNIGGFEAVVHRTADAGTVMIAFASARELDAILARLEGRPLLFLPRPTPVDAPTAAAEAL